jgi:hypothetical protein
VPEGGTAVDLRRTSWDYLVGSDLVYNEAGSCCLPRVMAALAGPRTRILYCHTKHRFDLLDAELFEQLAVCGLEAEEVGKGACSSGACSLWRSWLRRCPELHCCADPFLDAHRQHGCYPRPLCPTINAPACRFGSLGRRLRRARRRRSFRLLSSSLTSGLPSTEYPKQHRRPHSPHRSHEA